jgi:hypothetical protein
MILVSTDHPYLRVRRHTTYTDQFIELSIKLYSTVCTIRNWTKRRAKCVSSCCIALNKNCMPKAVVSLLYFEINRNSKTISILYGFSLCYSNLLTCYSLWSLRNEVLELRPETRAYLCLEHSERITLGFALHAFSPSWLIAWLLDIYYQQPVFSN